jgi:hypothetical protein
MKRKHDEVEIGADFVAISDDRGEVVRWVITEWVEDPHVVTAIANAITLAYMGRSVRGFIERNSKKALKGGD